MTAITSNRNSYLDDRMSSILSKHAALGRDENRQLGFTFCAQQQDITRYLAILVYPFYRLIAAYKTDKIKAGRKGADLDAQKEFKVGYRSPSFTKVHFAEIESFLVAIDQANGKAARDAVIGDLAIYVSTTFSWPCVDQLYGFMEQVENPVDGVERSFRLKAKNSYLLAVESRRMLIEGNYQLAAQSAYKAWRKISSTSASARMDVMDLFADSVRHGLTTSVDSYNPDRGAFSTYAVNWIDNAVDRSVKRNGSLMTVPFAQQTGAHARIQEFSLDAPISGDSSSDDEFHSVLADGETVGPDQLLVAGEMVQAVTLILGDMEPSHALFMGLRYGVGDAHASARAILFKEFQRSKAVADDIWAQHLSNYSTLPGRVLTYTGA